VVRRGKPTRPVDLPALAAASIVNKRSTALVSIDRLIERYGPDMAMPDLRHEPITPSRAGGLKGNRHRRL
jgi:hypothetical protein